MPVSLKDIAQSLNLSVATVSRALNNQGRISPKTRARVLKAMEQMHYRPNEAARALRQAGAVGVYAAAAGKSMDTRGNVLRVSRAKDGISRVTGG